MSANLAGKGTLTGTLAQKADELLPKVAQILAKENIPFCLDGGTLLGFYRENRFLPWDNDLDFFVRGSDAKRIRSLRWRLLWIGCRLSIRNASGQFGPIKDGDARVYKIKSIKRYDGYNVAIDLIFKYPADGYYHWVVGRNPPVHKKIERRYYDTFDSIQYNGRSYPIPCQTDDYLTARYGDWRVPQQEYDFKSDDYTIVR